MLFQKCDFEKDMCGWMNVANEVDDFDWLRAQAETLSYGTGPYVDHTLASSDGKNTAILSEKKLMIESPEYFLAIIFPSIIHCYTKNCFNICIGIILRLANHQLECLQE